MPTWISAARRCERPQARILRRMDDVPYSQIMAAAAKREIRSRSTLKATGELVGELPANMTKWTNGERLVNVDRLGEMVRASGGDPMVMFEAISRASISAEARWVADQLATASDDVSEQVVRVVSAIVGSTAPRPRTRELLEARAVLDQLERDDVRLLLALMRAMRAKQAEASEAKPPAEQAG